ncbi:hypothetical protein RB213_007048, partial [Colletotrichum asianum]
SQLQGAKKLSIERNGALARPGSEGYRTRLAKSFGLLGVLVYKSLSRRFERVLAAEFACHALPLSSDGGHDGIRA